MQFALRAVGWGVVIYAIMYLMWSGLVIYGLSFGLLSLILRLIVLAGITTIAARSLPVTTRTDIAPYSISWALTAVVLDSIYLVPFSGAALYAEWSVWVGYALVAIIPLLTYGSLRKGPRSVTSTRALHV